MIMVTETRNIWKEYLILKLKTGYIEDNFSSVR